jgi:hypothetical protein
MLCAPTLAEISACVSCLISPSQKKKTGTSIVGIIPYAAIDLGCNSLLKEIVCKRLEQKSSAPRYADVC